MQTVARTHRSMSLALGSVPRGGGVAFAVVQRGDFGSMLAGGSFADVFNQAHCYCAVFAYLFKPCGFRRCR